jgi:C4-dicarboxylate-specific signal transduction histidine kinase
MRTCQRQDRAKIEQLSVALEKQTPLPTLRSRHEALKHQLAQEHAKVSEVLACDQEVLSMRREELKEQKSAPEYRTPHVGGAS